MSKLDDSKLADLIKLAELLGPDGLEKLMELAKLDDAKLADLLKLAEKLGPDGLEKLVELAKLDDSKLANLIKLGDLLGPDGLARLADLAKLDDSKLAELIKLADALGPDGLKSLSDLAKLDDSKLLELAKLAEALGPEGLKNLAKLSDIDDEKLKLLAHLADSLGPDGLEKLSTLAGIDDSKLAELAKLAELVGPEGLKRLEELAKLDQEKLDEIKKLAEALGPDGLDKVTDPRLNDLAKLLDLLGPDGLNQLEDPRLPDLAKLAEMLGTEALQKLLELAKLTGMKGGNSSNPIDLPRLAELGRLAKEIGPEELSRLVDPNLLGLAGLAGDSGVSKDVKPSDLARLARLDAELAGLADPDLAALIEKLRENLDSTLSDLLAKAENDLLANPEALSELSYLKSQANLDPSSGLNLESDLSANEKVLYEILNSPESPEKMSQDFNGLPESSDPNQSLDNLGSKLRRKPGAFNKLKALRKALKLTPINEELTRANLADCLKDAEITDKLNKLLNSIQNDKLEQLKDLIDLNLNFAVKTAENELKSNADAIAELKSIKDKIFDENEKLASQLMDLVADHENFDQIKAILQGNEKEDEKLDEIFKIYKENEEDPEKTLESLEKLLRNRPVDPVMRKLRADLKLAPSHVVLLPSLVASSEAEKEINELKARSNELGKLIEELREKVNQSLNDLLEKAQFELADLPESLKELQKILDGAKDLIPDPKDNESLLDRAGLTSDELILGKNLLGVLDSVDPIQLAQDLLKNSSSFPAELSDLKALQNESSNSLDNLLSKLESLTDHLPLSTLPSGSPLTEHESIPDSAASQSLGTNPDPQGSTPLSSSPLASQIKRNKLRKFRSALNPRPLDESIKSSIKDLEKVEQVGDLLDSSSNLPELLKSLSDLLSQNLLQVLSTANQELQNDPPALEQLEKLKAESGLSDPAQVSDLLKRLEGLTPESTKAELPNLIKELTGKIPEDLAQALELLDQSLQIVPGSSAELKENKDKLNDLKAKLALPHKKSRPLRSLAQESIDKLNTALAGQELIDQHNKDLNEVLAQLKDRIEDSLGELIETAATNQPLDDESQKELNSIKDMIENAGKNENDIGKSPEKLILDQNLIDELAQFLQELPSDQELQDIAKGLDEILNNSGDSNKIEEILKDLPGPVADIIRGHEGDLSDLVNELLKRIKAKPGFRNLKKLRKLAGIEEPCHKPCKELAVECLNDKIAEDKLRDLISKLQKENEEIMEQLKGLVDETLLNSMNRAAEDWKNIKDDGEPRGDEFNEGESEDKGDERGKKILKKPRKALRKAGLTKDKIPEGSEGPTGDDGKLEDNKTSSPDTDVKAPEVSNPEVEEIIDEFEETNEMLKKIKEIQDILGMIQSPQIESRLIKALDEDLDDLVKSLTSNLELMPEVFKDLLSSQNEELPKSLDHADKILKLKPAHRKLKNLKSRLNPKQKPESVKDLAKECILELELNKTLESNRLPGVSPDLLENLQSDLERQIESLLNKVSSEQPNNLDLISQVNGILNHLDPEDPRLSALLSNLLDQLDENSLPNSLEDLNKDLQDLLQQLSTDPSQAFDLAAKSCNSRKDRKKLRNLRKNCKVKPSQDPNSILNECNDQVKALEKVQDLIKFGTDPRDDELLKSLKEKLDEKLEKVVNDANEILKDNPEALDEIKRILELSQQEGVPSNEGDEKRRFEDHDGKDGKDGKDDKDDKEEKKAGEPGIDLGSIKEKEQQGIEESKKEGTEDHPSDRNTIKEEKEGQDLGDFNENDIKDLQEFLNSIDLNNLPENLLADSSSLPTLLKDALNSNDQDLSKALLELAKNPKLKPLFGKSKTLRNASNSNQDPRSLLESCMQNLQAEALITDLLNRHDSLPGLLDAINSKLEDELRDAIANTQSELHSNPEALAKLAEIEAKLKNSDENLADSLDKVLKSLDPESLSKLSEGQLSELSPEGLKKALKGRSPSKKLRNIRKDLNVPPKSVPELAKDALENIETKGKVDDLLNEFSGLPELVAALKDKIEDDLKKEIKSLENILKDPKLLSELQAIKDSIKEDTPNLSDSIKDLLKELGNEEFERFEDLPKELQDLLNKAKNPFNVLDQIKDQVNGDKDLENCLDMLKGVLEGRPTVSDQVKDCIDEYDKLEKVKSLLNESSLLPGLLSDLKSELEKSLGETLSNCRDLLKSDPVLLQKLDEIEKSSGLLPLNPDLVSSLLSNLKSPEFSSPAQEEQSPLIKSLVSLLPSDKVLSLSSNPDLNEVIEALKSVLSHQAPIEDLINTVKPLVQDDNISKDNLALLEDALKPVVTSPAYIQDQASNCLKDVKAEKEAKSLLPNISDMGDFINTLNQKLADQLQDLLNDAENLIKDPEAIEKLKKLKENLQNSEIQPIPSQNILNNIESKDAINSLINAENLLNLKKLDDKSKDLLGQNLEKIERFLPKNEENDEKIQDLKKKAQEIDEIPTETQSDHATRVDKRLDLLSALELVDSELLKELNNTLQQKEAKIQDMQGHINEIEKESQDLAQKLQEASGSADKLAEDLKKMQDKVDDQEKLIRSQGDMLGNTNDENTKMLEKLNKDLQDRDKELRELKEKFGDEVAALNDLLSQAEADKEKNKQLIEEMQQNLDSLQKQVKDQADELAGKDDEINSLKDQVANLESELKQKEEELLNQAYDLKLKDDELAAKDAELQDSLSKLDELADELKAKDQQLSDLDNDLKLKNIEILDQAKQIKNQEDLIAAKENDLQQQASELKGLQDSLKDKEAELIEKNEDLAKADNLINVQKQQLDTQKELLQGAESGNNDALSKLSEEAAKNSKDLLDKNLELERLRRELEEREKERDQLSSDLESSSKSVEDLQNKLTTAEAAHKKGQVRHVLQIFKKKQGKLFKVWVRYSPDKQQVIQLVDTDDLDFIDEVEEVELKNDYIIADQLIDEENRILIETNPIMIQYKQIEGKTEKPMSYVNIFKFLEDLMDKKFETDKKDIKDLRQMRSMTEFMMESLQRQFGIQSLALKFLGQFIPGFYQIYGENHKYAIFFARLLQLFHPEPVTYSLALFLVKARTDFYPLIEKFERVMHDHGKKDIMKKADQTHGRSAYEAAATGGLAFVSDVIELVYSIFGGDRDSGTKALEIMKPENVTHEDFVLYKICHKMAKLGQTPEQIFNTLDKDGGGSISDKEFITGIKKDLDLWISESNISKLMKRMDTEGTGELSKEVFMKEINMKTFAEKNRNEIWTISKATFLIAMIEVYKFNQRRLTAHLNPKFSKFQKQALDKEEFEELMLGYETSLSVYDVEKLFNEAMSIDPSSVGASFKATTSIMCKYGFSYLKSFKIKELMENLTSRKTIVDVSLTPAEGPKRLFPSISISSEESKRDKNRSIGAEMIGTPTDKQATPSTPHRKLKSGVPPINEEEKKAKRPSGNLGLPPLPDDKGKSPSMIGKKASKK